LAFYVGVTLVVPLLRRPSLGGDARFLEHAVFVVGTILIPAVLARSFSKTLRHVCLRERAERSQGARAAPSASCPTR
jgi:hypothetical protein